MAALFVPLFFIFILCFSPSGIPNVNDSLILMSQKVEELSKLDREVALDAEDLSSLVNAALKLNPLIRSYQLACPAATLSGTVPSLQAASQATRLEQDNLLIQARMKMQSISAMVFERTLKAPEREADGPCGLAGVLYCPIHEIFKIQTYDGSKPAGVKGETQDCMELWWEFSDSRVRALK